MRISAADVTSESAVDAAVQAASELAVSTLP
jgi:hypothetical protein